MKILTSAIAFGMQHQSVQRHEVTESLRVWRTAPPPAAPAAAEAKPDQGPVAVTASPADLRLVLLQMLIERLTGRKLKLADVQGLLDASTSVPDLQDPNQTPSPARPDWGAVYSRQELHAESEQMRFAAAGLVRTADGKEITLSLSLTMSREFTSRTGIELRAGAAALKDPLVLNFNGSAAQLTGQSFSFDLDSDGAKEEVPMIGTNSAFLALDRNGDGVINDGGELFGTKSGNGFADLAALDSDHNGWIDESDPVFAQLKLWLPGAIQSGYISSLKEKGVGALYLGATDSEFALKEGEELNGQVRRTGVYLEEDGTAGTVQQIDLKA